MNGGGGSSFKKLIAGSNKGPIRTIFTGSIMVDTVFFQAMGESMPSKESGGLGKPRGPVEPKSELVIKRKINPQTIKRIMNFVWEMFTSKE